MRLLALDIATKTGWATWAPDFDVDYGVFELRASPSYGTRLGLFEKWLVGSLAHYQVDSVVIEERIHYPGKQSFASIGLAAALNAVVHLTCHGKSVQARDVNNGRIRKHFIGVQRGRRDKLKQLTMIACRARGWQPQDDNAADALALLDYEACRLRLDWPFANGLLFAQAGR